MLNLGIGLSVLFIDAPFLRTDAANLLVSEPAASQYLAERAKQICSEAAKHLRRTECGKKRLTPSATRRSPTMSSRVHPEPLRGRGRVQRQLGLGALIGGQRLAFAHPTRTHVFLTLPRSEALDSFVQLHAKGVQRHGHQGVLAHREHRVHELFGAVPLTQGRPGRIADEELRMQLVGRT